MHVKRTSLGTLLALTLFSSTSAAGIDDLLGTQPSDLPNGGNFKSAEICAGCHRTDANDNPAWKEHMPYDTWAGTMMGNAARDPVFFAALTVTNQDFPEMGTFCLRCHSPIAYVRGHASPPDGSGFDPNLSEGLVDTQGVGCDTCHRAAKLTDPADPNAPYYLANAQMLYEDDPDGTKRGPYSDANSPNHGSVQETSLASSSFCGQCHQVTNPEVMLRDEIGTPTTLEFPLDTTYEEWVASEFSVEATKKSCIDCHMRRADGDLPIVNLFDPKLRPNPRDHAIVGGNHWGIQAVMASPANAEHVEANQDAFALALDRTMESLRSAASVTLVEAPSEARPGEAFEVRVRVENLTGHKFPTGYAESRRAWVAVTLVDDEGVERTLLGGYDTATGEIVTDPPTHVYKAVHGKWNDQLGVGEAEEHLALHDMIISDTRIPPRGFVPSDTTRPTQEIDFTDGNGGYRSFDEASFTVTAPSGASGMQTLSVRVYYQSMTRHYIEFLRDQNVTDDRGQLLEEIYLATGEAPPILIASADAPIDFGGSAGPGGGGGQGGTGGTGSGGSPPNPSNPGDDGGCGCRAAGAGDAGPLAAAALTGLALVAATRRRRRR
ncbi:MYXO-CTERM sorting domain-containing protein [Chondromyces apiculatus]|uniref:Uncharacterized protein n=1 Tax=Chondromyces apiculatus DSM 436 TaxID=1192034 RepID=A0A017T1H7_9BACT|nr:MYXO-CTERM sorting domain-containing protein [Chondromyces apiculatus]EYF03048.1 Hypothetical protein CAP_6311 [Chondromyces apiculatus DSM 436]